MIEEVKKNLAMGITRFKWFAEFVADRTRAETTIARLLYESTKIEDKMNELYIDVGKRVAVLKEKGEEAILKDFIIQQSLDEIKTLKKEAANNKKQAKTINKLPD